MAEREWADKDYYADLGVSSSAGHDEIKRAYRKIARENHPDKKPGDKAAEARFKRAAEAYDVVGDEKKRKEYDEFRAMIAHGGFGGTGFPPGGFRTSTQGANGFNVNDIFGQGGGFSAEGGLGDLFGDIFGGRGGGRQRASSRSRRASRGADVETQITLDFREAAKGTTLPLQISGEAPCATCHGSGSRSGEKANCPECDGTGYTNEQRGAFGFSAPCAKCQGTGEVIEDPCTTCSGTGTVHRTRSITVRIPAGVIDGQKVRLAGQGEAGPNGRPSGDLFVTVHVRDDAVFTRKGDDLEVTVPVSFAELALGDTVTVPTLDSPVRVKIPAGTRDGRTLRVRGRGINGGDLLVTVEVNVPTHLDAAATSALRTYAQAERESGFDPRADWEGARR
ncbi:molecular chaperone DnaJ [Corynebacterium frankenforstense DSM 45800]|uniref:Chaperone protein DnaJ n=1 Tax=Corynebacterium frankenforstense DSM 45800 TaxID=1437875 RepID=A0A1L7CUX4_9CORY|nr:molecular chaperone DnaJ [Corynebacterium frankenforstense]APT89617.1 molecular chaperone DnaJ [Corynebacterium frankenforstense DSM 45800]